MENNGGPAFPIEGNHVGEVEWHMGMTLRDYFAAKAMSALADRNLNKSNSVIEDYVALMAYRYADAMLAERAKK